MLLPVQTLQILLQTQPLFVHLCCVVSADEAVVPGLEGVAGDGGLVLGIAEDEAVLVGVIPEPLISFGIGEGNFVEEVILTSAKSIDEEYGESAIQTCVKISTIPLFFEQTDYEVVIQSKDGKSVAFWHENPRLREKVDRVTDENPGLISGIVNFGSNVGFSARKGDKLPLDALVAAGDTQAAAKDLDGAVTVDAVVACGKAEGATRNFNQFCGV